jgi:hypothetical protein
MFVTNSSLKGAAGRTLLEPLPHPPVLLHARLEGRGAVALCNVIDLDAVRDSRVEALYQRAIKLSRYRRLMITLAACELLREYRRVRRLAPRAETST